MRPSLQQARQLGGAASKRGRSPEHTKKPERAKEADARQHERFIIQPGTRRASAHFIVWHRVGLKCVEKPERWTKGAGTPRGVPAPFVHHSGFSTHFTHALCRTIKCAFALRVLARRPCMHNEHIATRLRVHAWWIPSSPDFCMTTLRGADRDECMPVGPDR